MNFKNKNAVALATVNLAATIGIIVILTLYVVLGVVVKNLDVGVKEVDKKLEKSEVLRYDFYNYLLHFKKLIRVRKLMDLNSGMSVISALNYVNWAEIWVEPLDEIEKEELIEEAYFH